jgi:hypothetical protein
VGIPGSQILPPQGGTSVFLLGIFALYMAIALAWLLLQRTRRPRMISQMQDAIEQVHRQFAQVGAPALTPSNAAPESPPPA